MGSIHSNTGCITVDEFYGNNAVYDYQEPSAHTIKNMICNKYCFIPNYSQSIFGLCCRRGPDNLYIENGSLV
jgi:hypothetical protein